MHNTIGDKCEKCDASFIGDATKGTLFDCLPENTECNQNIKFLIYSIFIIFKLFSEQRTNF